MRFVSLVVVIAALSLTAHAQVPQRLGYQGRLLKADGSPEAGALEVTFSLHDSATGGTALWREVQNLGFVDGFYAVQLGEATPLPASIFDGAPRWLELNLGGSALTPRQAVASVPYAVQCSKAREVTGGAVNASSLTVNGQAMTDVEGRLDWARIKGCAGVGEILKWTGTGWACQPDAGGMTEVSVGPPLAGAGTTASPLSIPAASGSGNGYLSAADWTVFNGKLSGVTAGGPLVGAGTAASPLSMPAASGSGNGYLSAADWTVFNGKVSTSDSRLSDARAPTAGSANYLQNQTGAVQTASFRIGGTGAVGGDLTVGGKLVLPLGESPDNPATGCAALLQSRAGLASGVYWLKPSSASAPFRAFCDMVTEGGGWTLVWSNLRGGRGKVTTEIQWRAAINTLPLARGDVSTHLESFEVYTGLAHWVPLALNPLTPKLRYDWATDYGAAIDQRWTADYTLLPGNAYQISFTNGSSRVGSVTPGLFTLHNNQRFTTYNADNDIEPGNCATYYSNTPWWYTNCWSGSISGGGEFSGQTYANGAYWTGSMVSWGSPGGNGAGNGWIYVK